MRRDHQKGLKECLARQIRASNVVSIVGGMYAAHSEWIDYKMDESVRMRGSIIDMRPWGQERMPQKLQNIAE